MPDDVGRALPFGDHWGSDGFEVSGLDCTESELDMAGCSTAAEGSSSRSYRWTAESFPRQTADSACYACCHIHFVWQLVLGGAGISSFC